MEIASVHRYGFITATPFSCARNQSYVRTLYARMASFRSIYCLRSAHKYVRCLSTALRPEGPSTLESLHTKLLPEQNALNVQDSLKTLIRPISKTLHVQLISPHVGSRKASQAPSLVLLNGAKGVGKSSLVMQTVVQARKNGFLVLYIPNSREWTHGGGFFSPTAVEGMEPHLDGLSAIRFYDRPFQTQNLFRWLLEAHAKEMADMSCHEQFSSPLTQHCATLQDLVQFGEGLIADVDSNWRENPKLAGDVLHQLIQELSISERPVALVIDDYEHFIGMTCMANEKKQRMHANSIRIIAQQLGRDAINNTAQSINGFVMLAMNSAPAFENWRSSRIKSGVDFPISEDIRSDPSGREWWHTFKNEITKEECSHGLYIDVPPLQPGELKAICATFVRGGLRRNTDRTKPKVDRLIALAGGRGDIMEKVFAVR